MDADALSTTPAAQAALEALRAAPRAAVADGHGPGGRAGPAGRPRRRHRRDRELRPGSPVASRTLPRCPARRVLAPGWRSRPRRAAPPPGEPHRCLLLPTAHASVGANRTRSLLKKIAVH